MKSLVLVGCAAALCLGARYARSESGCFGSGATVGADGNGSGGSVLLTVHVDDGVCHTEETPDGLISVVIPCVSQMVTAVVGVSPPGSLVIRYVYADGSVLEAAPQTLPKTDQLVHSQLLPTKCGKDLRVEAEVAGIGTASAAMRCSTCIT